MLCILSPDGPIVHRIHNAATVSTANTECLKAMLQWDDSRAATVVATVPKSPGRMWLIRFVYVWCVGAQREPTPVQNVNLDSIATVASFLHRGFQLNTVGFVLHHGHLFEQRTKLAEGSFYTVDPSTIPYCDRCLLPGLRV